MGNAVDINRYPNMPNGNGAPLCMGVVVDATIVGVPVGAPVHLGTSVGASMSTSVGAPVGAVLRSALDDALGAALGAAVGTGVGDIVSHMPSSQSLSTRQALPPVTHAGHASPLQSISVSKPPRIPSRQGVAVGVPVGA